MAWAAIAVAGQWAVTHTTSTTFDKPVRVGQPYRVEAKILEVVAEQFDAVSTKPVHAVPSQYRRGDAPHGSGYQLGEALPGDDAAESVDGDRPLMRVGR